MRAAKKLSDFGYAGMQLQTNITLKSSGYADAEYMQFFFQMAKLQLRT
jgi:hypothetical protein